MNPIASRRWLLVLVPLLAGLILSGVAATLVYGAALTGDTCDGPSCTQNAFESASADTPTATPSATNTPPTWTPTVTPSSTTMPEAHFVASPLQGPAPLPVHFQNTSCCTVIRCYWNFGDGATFTDVSGGLCRTGVDHTYQDPGSYTVSLSVCRYSGFCDDETKADYIQVLPGTTITPTVTPSPTATNTPYVLDQFSRNVTNGWGSAPVGGEYTIANDSFSNFAVNGSAGTMKAMHPNRFLRSMLMSVSALNVDASFRVKTDKSSTQGGQIAYFVSRRTGTGNDYLARLRFTPTGSVRLQAERELSNVPYWIVPEVSVPGLTHTPNQYYRLRVQVTGANPTTIRMKAWADGATEPNAWQLTATDSTYQLQSPGAVGLRAYLGKNASSAPVTFTFDDFLVQAP